MLQAFFVKSTKDIGFFTPYLLKKYSGWLMLYYC